MDDWDIDEPTSGTSTPPAPVLPKPSARSKWQDEDKEESEEDDWDVSDSEKPKKTAAPTTTSAPPKKKLTLKQKLAEKERLAAERGDENEVIETLTEQDRRRIARERELESDLATAADLMGSTGVEDAGEALKAIVTAKPTTKADFATFSTQIMSTIISPHTDNALYAAFVEQLAKDLCEGLTAVQTRKVSSALSVLGNTKQQEERDKASGKKKTTAKPKLAAGSKTISKADDMEAYDDVLEDDDFM